MGGMFDDIVMPDASSLSGAANDMSLGPPASFLGPELSSPSMPLTLQSPQQLSMPAPAPAPHGLEGLDALDMDAPQSMDVQVSQQMQFLFNAEPQPPLAIPGLPLPKIHRLIPATGPTYGGIEITVLGANFHPNMQLNCVFGDARSTSTQRWSDNTLVCLLPPSPTPGVVAVWFDGLQQKEEDGTPPSLFAYTDETDRAL